MSRPFKNTKCLDLPPDSRIGFMSGYWHRCQRKKNHPPPHRSRSFEWNDGDRESRPREKKA